MPPESLASAGIERFTGDILNLIFPDFTDVLPTSMLKSLKKEEKQKWAYPGNPATPLASPREGALNKTTLATQALFEEEAEALTRKVIELAKDGNITTILETHIKGGKAIPFFSMVGQLE